MAHGHFWKFLLKSSGILGWKKEQNTLLDKLKICLHYSVVGNRFKQIRFCQLNVNKVSHRFKANSCLGDLSFTIDNSCAHMIVTGQISDDSWKLWIFTQKYTIRFEDAQPTAVNCPPTGNMETTTCNQIIRNGLEIASCKWLPEQRIGGNSMKILIKKFDKCQQLKWKSTMHLEHRWSRFADSTFSRCSVFIAIFS